MKLDLTAVRGQMENGESLVLQIFEDGSGNVHRLKPFTSLNTAFYKNGSFDGDPDVVVGAEYFSARSGAYSKSLEDVVAALLLPPVPARPTFIVD